VLKRQTPNVKLVDHARRGDTLIAERYGEEQVVVMDAPMSTCRLFICMATQ
jgi:hypothetical protein